LPDHNWLRRFECLAAREKPCAIGRPSDFLLAPGDAARIGGVKPFQGARVVNLDGRGVIKADGELHAIRVRRNAEGLLAAFCSGLLIEAPIRVIAADLTVIGYGVEPVRAIESCAIAALAAIVFVLGEKPPASCLPKPHTFTARERSSKAATAGGESEMVDHRAKAGEPRDEAPRGGFENVSIVVFAPAACRHPFAVRRQRHGIDLALIALADGHAQGAQLGSASAPALRQRPKPRRLVVRACHHQAAGGIHADPLDLRRMHARLDAQSGPLIGHILSPRRSRKQHAKKYRRYNPHAIYPQPNHPLRHRKTPPPFTIPDCMFALANFPHRESAKVSP
jgi:hypothetical protein